MKKLILGIVFILLTALFIAFNYLLWDREIREKDLRNLELSNVSNTATINAQKREISTLETELKNLDDKIKQLDSEKAKLSQDKSDIATEKTKIDAALQEKIRFINILKQYTVVEEIADPVIKWVDALNQGKYKEAYDLEYAGAPEQKGPMNLTVYTNEMEGILKSIEISEIKLDKLRGSTGGDIILAVKLNVELADDVTETVAHFSNGNNIVYIKLEYSYEEKSFIISSIDKN